MAVVNEGGLKKMLKVSVASSVINNLLVSCMLADVVDAKLDTISNLAQRRFRVYTWTIFFEIDHVKIKELPWSRP